MCNQIDLFQEGADCYRVLTPFLLEDGDHLAIVLRHENSGWILSDEGHTYMRLGYDMDGGRQKIITNALSMFKVEDRDGELVLAIQEDHFGDALFSFSQALLKVSACPWPSPRKCSATPRQRAAHPCKERVGMRMDNIKQQKLTDVFPLNLVRDIFDSDEIAVKAYIPNIPVVLGTLTEREADILRKRYDDKLTLSAIGYTYGISRECVRQIEAKALRKLRHTKRASMIKAVPLSDIRETETKYQKLSREYEHLAEAFALLSGKQAEPGIILPLAELAATMQTPIEDLGLSVRSHNCLKRAGKNTLRDIADMSENDLMRIRNVGSKSAQEVIGCIKKYGIYLKGATPK